MKLVELKPLLKNALFDLRYASEDNITGEVLYHDNPPALDTAAAQQLKKVEESLEVQGYRLVIWDAYRPAEVQEKLRAIQSDSRYVAEDSNHNHGVAIDLSLALADGTYLDMGTDFDDFTPAAHVEAEGLTDNQQSNRQILAAAMEEHGFRQWPYEWWHFDYEAE